MTMNSYAGLKTKNPGYSFQTGSYEQYQTICVTSGHLIADVREGDVHAGPGAVLHLPAGSSFSLRCTAASYTGVFAVVEGDLEKRFYGRAKVLVAPPAMQQVVTLMRHEATEVELGAEAVIRHLGRALAELTVRLARQEGVDEPNRSNRDYWAERVRERIDLHLYSGRAVGEMLEGLELGPRQLARHFRAATGLTPKQYHLHRRLEQAVRLLGGSDLSVTSVALELGFPSPQHFATQFRRVYGVSPSVARRAPLTASACDPAHA
jgi:AraC-like DNA-binding protein